MIKTQAHIIFYWMKTIKCSWYANYSERSRIRNSVDKLIVARNDADALPGIPSYLDAYVAPPSQFRREDFRRPSAVTL